MNLLFLHGNLIDIIRTLGYLGVSLVVFAESGLFFGFFLPGDSLLFTSGLLASQGFFNIYLLTTLLGISAIAGDSVGYWFGYKIGPALFNKEDSFFFNKNHITKAHLFYEKYGVKAVILGRFIPIVRTFVPILAGVGKMKYSIFLKNNIIGGLLWAVGMTTLGYILGNSIPNIDTYLLPIIILIIFISFLPVIFEFLNKKN